VEIFISNLPEEIEAADLKNLLKDSLQKNLFQKLFNKIVSQGSLDNDASYSVFQKEFGGEVRQYGHIGINSDKLASVAVESLQNINYQGHNLVAREYLHRAYSNDRRDEGWREHSWLQEERRLVERRESEDYSWGL